MQMEISDIFYVSEFLEKAWTCSTSTLIQLLISLYDYKLTIMLSDHTVWFEHSCVLTTLLCIKNDFGKTNVG